MKRILMKSMSMALSLVLNLSASQVSAFQILSPATDGCHENMMLAVLEGSPSLLARFEARAREAGVPSDGATLGMIRGLADDHGFDSSDSARAWVIASFLAGVRDPDSDGFSIVDLNEQRGVHLRSEEQSAHFLRAEDDDGPMADRRAVDSAKRRIVEKAESAMVSWSDVSTMTREEKYNLPFYGDVKVRIFVPAFDLGLASHVIQDSYAHTIRDESLRIVAVANYIDVILHDYDETTDGPGHSDRMDRCKIQENEFDAKRFEYTRLDTIGFLSDVENEIANGRRDSLRLRERLDRIFVVRNGCDVTNRYCETEWYTEFAKGSTKPWKVGCTGISGPELFALSSEPLGPASAFASLFGVMLFWWQLRRKRSKRSCKYDAEIGSL